MKVFQWVFDFYIDASIHVALAVYALIEITRITFEISEDGFLGYAVFFGTIVTYNFIKYGSGAEKFVIVDTNYLRWIQGFSFLCFGLGVYFLFRVSLETIFWIIGLGLLSVLYILPLGRSLRSFQGLKIVIVALVWSGVTVLLPLVNDELLINQDVYIVLFQRFLFVLALILPFEIRDLKYDKLSLKTIPQQIGIRATKILGFLLLLTFFAVNFLRNNVEIYEWIVLFLISLTTLFFLLFTKKNQEKYYCSFWVESIPVFWWFLYVFRDLFYEASF